MAAARAQRAARGRRWWVTATERKIGGRWRYVERASDASGHSVNISGSERRCAQAARMCFTPAMATSDVPPAPLLTDTATRDPQVVRPALPVAAQRCATSRTPRLQREPPSLTGRGTPLRGGTDGGCARTCWRGPRGLGKRARGGVQRTGNGAPRLRRASAGAARATRRCVLVAPRVPLKTIRHCDDGSLSTTQRNPRWSTGMRLLRGSPATQRHSTRVRQRSSGAAVVELQVR